MRSAYMRALRLLLLAPDYSLSSISAMIFRSLYQHINRSVAALMPAVVLLLSLVIAAPSRADVINVSNIKEWQKNLREAQTMQDSIEILYNLFDISLRSDTGVYSRPLIELCERARDYDTELDIIRKVVNKNDRNEAIIDSMRTIVARLPYNENQRETMIFIEIRKLLADYNDMDDTERIKLLNDYIEEYEDDPSKGLYDRILPLYKLTVALGLTVGGELYADYMDRLAILIRQLPSKNGPLTSLYTTQAAMNYSFLGENEKAVEANKAYLAIIKELIAENEAKGHVYASYKNNEYLALRRMLTCYEALTPAEIDSAYNRMGELIVDDPELADEFNNLARATSFYLVAKKRYPEAIKAIDKALKNEKNRNYRIRLLKLQMESAEAVGDRETLSDARGQYIELLEKRLEANRSDKVRELGLLLSVNNNSQERLEETVQELSDTKRHYRLIIAIILSSVFLILAGLTVGFRYLLGRRRKMAASKPADQEA